MLQAIQDEERVDDIILHDHLREAIVKTEEDPDFPWSEVTTRGTSPTPVAVMVSDTTGMPCSKAKVKAASRRAIPHVMLSDCRSLVANLNTEVPSRVHDKMLQIELDAIRQSIFDGDGRRTAAVYPKRGDHVDWEATATQIADCLTKSMKPTYMLKVLDTCRYQISREGYSKPSAGGEATAPIGQEELESAMTEPAAVGKATVGVTSGKTPREQVECEHLPVSQSCVKSCCS